MISRPPAMAACAQGGEPMKAVAWHGRRDVRVDTVPDPSIGKPTDAIVHHHGDLRVEPAAGQV
jgi:hypothetical protein